MADRDRASNPAQRPPSRTTIAATGPPDNNINNNNNNNNNVSTFLRKLQAHASNSNQLTGFLTLLITGSILFMLSGITVTAAVMGLIFLSPLFIISSPIWVPVGVVLLFFVAGFLSFCGFLVAIVGGFSWMYRYYRGLSPPGSDRFDYARSRIYDTASHVKDYAREYGGYLQSKVKDAAPGA